MNLLRLSTIIPALEGVVVSGWEDRIFRRVATRSGRITRRATLYFHYSGNEFKLRIRPRSLIIVTENPGTFKEVEGNITVVKVDSVNKAYWDFINFYRSQFQIPVIGITGTCGKTTTVEMLKRILSRKFPIQATYNGNNALAQNQRYLLKINHRTKAAIFEMGVSSPGTILKSCAYFKPNIGVILNIGTYHLLGCETMEAYIKAKADMLMGLNNEGTLIINADDENIKKIDFSQYKGKIIKIGFSKDSDYLAENINYSEEGMSFTLKANKEEYLAIVPGYGKHNVYNALAAIAVSTMVGLSVEETIKYLAEFRPVRKHLQIKEGINSCKLIDDTWNCTPPSMKVALEVLKDLARGRKKVAALGYMPQLGKAGEEEYLKVGECVVKEGIDYLITIGELARQIGDRAIALGMPKEKVAFFENGEEVYAKLAELMDKDTLVLLKFPYKFRLKKIESFRRLMQSIII